MNRGMTFIEIMILTTIITIIAAITITEISESRAISQSEFQPGTKVVADGRSGILTCVDPYTEPKYKVRVVMRGENGAERYEQVWFFSTEVVVQKLKAEEE